MSRTSEPQPSSLTGHEADRRGQPYSLRGGWWLDVTLLAGFLALTVALVAGTPLLRLDTTVAHWCDGHRPRAGYLTARIFNLLGQGTPLTLLTLGVAGWRAWVHRSVRPFLVPVMAFVLLYLSVGPLKVFTARPAPTNRAYPHPERLFAGASRDLMEYPSGHVANTFVWYLALVIVLGGVVPWWLRRVLLVLPVLVVLVTTTYLSWHWVTDGAGGVLIGLVLARILRRVRWDSVPLRRLPVVGERLARCGWDRPAGLDPVPCHGG